MPPLFLKYILLILAPDLSLARHKQPLQLIFIGLHEVGAKQMLEGIIHVVDKVLVEFLIRIPILAFLTDF